MSHRKYSSRNVFPFLLLIFFGLGCVFFLNFGIRFFHRTQNAEKKEAVLYVEKGNAQVLPWGSSVWIEIEEQRNLLEGDTVHVSKAGLALVHFYGENIIRLDENTEFQMDSLNIDGAIFSVETILYQGAIWVHDAADDFSFFVRSDDMSVAPFENEMSRAHIFSITQDVLGSVRALDGGLRVNVLDRGEPERVLENFVIESGEAMSIGEKDIGALENFRTVQPIYPIDEDFKQSQWYAWNTLEDAFPMKFLERHSVKRNAQKADIQASVTKSFENVNASGSYLTLISPSNPFTTTDTRAEIRGIASKDIFSIVVMAKGENYSDIYTLESFHPGDTVWVYRADMKYKNLAVGTNTYEIAGYGQNGEKSAVLQFTLIVR